MLRSYDPGYGRIHYVSNNADLMRICASCISIDYLSISPTGECPDCVLNNPCKLQSIQGKNSFGFSLFVGCVGPGTISLSGFSGLTGALPGAFRKRLISRRLLRLGMRVPLR